MRDKIKQFDNHPRINTYRTVIGFALVGLLFVASIALIYERSIENGRLSRENQGYIRYLACLADIRNELGALTVSDEVSEACWKQAEKETGIPLARYTEKVILNRE